MSLVQHARERWSSVLSLPAPERFDDALLTGATGRRPAPFGPAPEGLREVPGDAGMPLLGHAPAYVRFGHRFTRARTEALGPVWWMRSPAGRAIVVTGPAATREVLTNRDKAFSQEGWRATVDAFFHRGLMLLDFDEHRAHRRIMQEAFTADRIAGYVATTTPVLREVMPTWPTELRLHPALKRLTLDVAQAVFAGGRSGPEAEAVNRAFVDCVRAANSFVRKDLPGTRWRRGLRGRAVLEDWFRSNLDAKRAGGGSDLFSALCHAQTGDGERFSDDDVVNHMIFLMMAAHDTSTTTAASAAFHLARDPHWQDRCRAQSDALAERIGDAVPTVDDLRSLTDIDLVIREALRMDAPVPVVMRTAVTDTTVAGRHVPAGTRVVVAQAVNHYDPSCWSDPERFDPDRFGPERREDRSDRDAWIPFGGGVHKCIGLHFGTLEVTAILHEMLQRFRWTVDPAHRLRWDNTSLPVPVGGIPVTLRRRD
ncbi:MULTISPECIES: cytochrome P450 [Pseudonocardia]|uniref:Cytochrome P450 n=2 Tax=Pseudonocardia TaxID=1847 RepID=A0ABQ0RUV2_9PSEU|nr:MULTISPECIES: cytochrome P450 [Pseudonocardia]OSY42799.1 putative cytochrome P450 120 [Pseudonocardia autotrophica]TDN77376.1 cytochrome P450 [Pseudonocardia autotrophica]BBG01399.1 putative cytochrome P450 [Pseudonocardia autotrophica]GEC24455.1 putative cytochrome P450 [Pseudonocardia saturnea]